MHPSDRIEYIREGNTLYNKGEFAAAAKLYIKANYQDGLERIGDTLMDKHQFLAALQYYSRAKKTEKVEEIMNLLGATLKIFLTEEKADLDDNLDSPQDKE